MSVDVSETITNPMAHFLRAKRWQITLTYTLNLIENAIELLYPLLIGMSINGLLEKEYDALYMLIGMWFAHTVIAGIRQIYDTRLFANILAKIASHMAINLRRDGKESGEVSAQVDMAREYIEFFEIEIPALLTILISLIGSMILLAIYDLMAGAIIFAFIIPVGVIYYWLTHQSIALNNSINNLQEKQVKRITHGKNHALKKHFNIMARWRIRLSNADAASWSAAELILLIGFVLVLLRLIALPDVNAGMIFASIAYLINIIDDLEHIPDTMQQIGRLIDIRNRIDRQGL